MLKANIWLRHSLGSAGVEFLEHASGAIQRILPHVQVSGWKESGWIEPSSVWTSSSRTKIRITLAVRRSKKEVDFSRPWCSADISRESEELREKLLTNVSSTSVS
jgi:hypothetical protein